MEWLLMKDQDGDFQIVNAGDVAMIAQRAGEAKARVSYRRDGNLPEDYTDVVSISVMGSIESALYAMNVNCSDGVKAVRQCRVCGCVDEDCRQCIEKTGLPCHWVEDDLCSACVDDASLIAEIDKAEGVEPELDGYAKVLHTRECPHCSADIGDNIFECPVCDKPLGAPPAAEMPTWECPNCHTKGIPTALRICPCCGCGPIQPIDAMALLDDAGMAAESQSRMTTAARIAKEMREGTAEFRPSVTPEQIREGIAHVQAVSDRLQAAQRPPLDEDELPIGALKLSNPIGSMWRVLTWDGEYWKLAKYRESYRSRDEALRAIVERGEYWRLVGDRDFRPWDNDGEQYQHIVTPNDHGHTLAVVHVKSGKVVAIGDASCHASDWIEAGNPTMPPAEKA